MSSTALRRLFRTARHTCRGCSSRPARFRYHPSTGSGQAARIRADRDHTLCFRCFRSEVGPAARANARRVNRSRRVQKDPAYNRIHGRESALPNSQ